MKLRKPKPDLSVQEIIFKWLEDVNNKTDYIHEIQYGDITELIYILERKVNK